MNNKEFDRSVCFQFYESYLEQAEQVKEQLGAETCAEYFIALARYGLYQEESTNPIVKMLISGLKNTIDAGQSKREMAFGGENKDLTQKILQYKTENPNATQREIADACGCSLGKVNKTVTSNNNLNNNINNNSNTNNNSVNMNVNTRERRTMKDLTKEEAEEIIKKIKRKERYVDIQKEYNLEYGVITKDFENQWQEILINNKHEEDQLMLNLNHDKYVYLQGCWGLDSINEAMQRMNSFSDKYSWTIDETISALQQNSNFDFNTYRSTVPKKNVYDQVCSTVNEVPTIKYPEWLNFRMCNFYKK